MYFENGQLLMIDKLTAALAINDPVRSMATNYKNVILLWIYLYRCRTKTATKPLSRTETDPGILQNIITPHSGLKSRWVTKSS